MPIVAVTGTNGKTTVTTLIAAMLDASGVRTVAAGNIGRPLIDAVGDPTRRRASSPRSRRSSSRSLRDVPAAASRSCSRSRPTTSTGTARFERLRRGQGAGSSTHQTGDDLLVFDADDPSRGDDRGGARRHGAVGFSRVPTRPGASASTATDARVPRRRTCSRRSRRCARALVHDRTNALAAAAAPRSRSVRPTAGSWPRSASYATLPHRVALVGEAGGVEWYDDSKATNPDATLRARRVVRFGRAARRRPQQGSRPRRARGRPIAPARRRRVRRSRARGRSRVPRHGRRSSNARVDARRRARRGAARATGRRGVAVTGVCVVRRVRRTTPSAATTSPPRCGSWSLKEATAR